MRCYLTTRENFAAFNTTYLAFMAESQAAVDAFHRAALAAGGIENGAPGPRPRYHAGYYGAFVLDLHANNVEAVHHGGIFDA